MPHIARILAATDFSLEAGRAVKRAARLAHEAKADLHLVWVAEEHVADLLRRLVPGAADAERAAAVAPFEQRLRALAELLEKHYSVRTAAHACHGAPHARILETADRVRADLVALGARGLQSYRDFFFGSTAARVLRLAPQPVLVVRRPESAEYENVLAAVDFSPRSAAVIDFARTLAPGAYVEAVHVIAPLPEELLRHGGVPAPAVETLRAYETNQAALGMQRLVDAAGPGRPLHPVTVHGNPAQVLVERANRLRRDLVVLGRRSGTEQSNALVGSVARHVAEDTACDVLLTA